MTVAELVAPFPDGPPHPERAGSIAEALSRNIGALRQSGHNVIFAALALKALREHPSHATSEIVTGICRLIAGFDGEHPGRLYFGEERGWIGGDQVPPPDNDMPPYADERAMAEAVGCGISSTTRRR
jgi:hypothetical protein